MIRLCSIFLFICLGLTGQTIAKQVCDNPVFGVSGIKIDETASTASQAQIIAMEDAQSMAFQTVLERLLISPLSEDVGLAPQDFIELVHIQTETSLPGRYLAEIDVCFSPLMMRSLFADNQLSWAEVVSPPVLVLPVFSSPAGVRAWQDNQPWLQSWREAVNSHSGLVDFTTLKANLANERQLQAERLFFADEALLAKAAGRAKAEQILLVRAQQRFKEDGQPLLVIYGDLHAQDGGKILSLLQREIDISSISETNLQKLYRDIISDITSQLETGWRSSNARTTDSASKMVAHLSFDNLDQWVARKKAIENTKAIVSVSLLSLSINKAVISLELAGSTDAIRYAFEPIGLQFVIEDGVGYILDIQRDKAVGQE